MYTQFYGFREKPFSLLPDPEFLFLSQKHEKALNLLELGILNQSGFCIISGEIGALTNSIDTRFRGPRMSAQGGTVTDSEEVFVAFHLQGWTGEDEPPLVSRQP